jgi:hypothetical protein
VSEVFTKKDAEEFKKDFQHFLDLLFSGNQPKLRYVMDTQMNLRQQIQVSADLEAEITNKMRDLSINLLDIMKEHGNLVIAQIRINRKLDGIITEQEEIKQLVEI